MDGSTGPRRIAVRYGYAIQVNEILRLTPYEFEERPVNWIPPSWGPGLIGPHALKGSSGLQVIDSIRWHQTMLFQGRGTALSGNGIGFVWQRAIRGGGRRGRRGLEA